MDFYFWKCDNRNFSGIYGEKLCTGCGSFDFLEFGQGMCPKAITDIWKRLDGYWYSANLFKPLENITEKMNNFQVIYTSDFKGAEGFGIWSLGLIAAVFVLIMMARRMEC